MVIVVSVYSFALAVVVVIAAAAVASAGRQVRLFVVVRFFAPYAFFHSALAQPVRFPVRCSFYTLAAAAGVVPAAKVIRRTFRIAALATK